jgi:hypothetical protein
MMKNEILWFQCFTHHGKMEKKLASVISVSTVKSQTYKNSYTDWQLIPLLNFISVLHIFMLGASLINWAAKI